MKKGKQNQPPHKPGTQPTSQRTSAIGKSLLFAAAIFSIYFFSVQLLVRVGYYNARNFYKEQSYQQATVTANRSLKRSSTLLPGTGNFLFKGDAYRLNKLLGECYLRLASQQSSAATIQEYLERSLHSFNTARELAPDDLSAMAGVARVTAELERLASHQRMDRDYDAWPLFQDLTESYPDNHWVRQMTVNYLGRGDNREELNTQVEQLVRLWPASYFGLRKGSYYNKSIQQTVYRSLTGDLEFHGFNEQARRRSAYRVLWHIQEENGDKEGAVSSVEKYLEVAPEQNTSADHHKFGQLLLALEKLGRAEEQFLAAIERSTDHAATVHSIWRTYKAEEKYEEFLHFYEKLEEDESFLDVPIFKAYAYMEMEQYNLALFYLSQVVSRKNQAEKYYLQARIAEKQDDTDSMELMSQKATVLAPDNPGYHLLFARALTRNNKFSRAEEAVTRAIDALQQPNPWYFNQRANLRWQQKNFAGAEKDWQRAVELQPENPHFIYRLALAAEKREDRSGAVRLLESAIQYKPDEAVYHDKLRQLQAR